LNHRNLHATVTDKNCHGPDAGRKCIGCSLAVDRQAKIILQATYGEAAEELRVVEVDLRTVAP